MAAARALFHARGASYLQLGTLRGAKVQAHRYGKRT
jgi:hypothetical protein